MERRMRAVALLAGCLSIGVIGGTVTAQTDRISEPVTLELTSTGPTISKDWTLQDDDAETASVSLLTEPVVDGTGASVGTHTWECLQSEPVGWFCSGHIQLDEGAETASGTLELMGRFEGFSGESMAVVGGTGAYAAASGEAVLVVRDDAFTRVITLYP